MVGFNGIPFEVIVDDDGRLPYPEPDESQVEWYEAEIRLLSELDYNTIRDLRSRVTVLPALGGPAGAGTVQVEYGSGSRVLIWPDGPASTHSSNAILTEIRTRPAAFRYSDFRVTCKWLIQGDV